MPLNESETAISVYANVCINCTEKVDKKRSDMVVNKYAPGVNRTRRTGNYRDHKLLLQRARLSYSLDACRDLDMCGPIVH